MSVIRKHHNKNYTVMSNYHFLDRELSLKAKGLLSLMLSLPGDWDYSTVGLESLSSDGNTSVRNALKELEEHEYLIRERVFKNGKIVDWEYHIFECAEDCRAYKHDKNQHDENQHVADNDNKIRKQSNTKKVNTKNSSKEELQSGNFQFGSKQSKPKKENLYTKCVNMVSDFVSEHNCGEPVRGKLMDYLRFRLEVKDKPLYTNMWKGMLGKLETLHRQGYGYEPIISYSLERGYLSFYAPNDFSSGSVKNKPWEQGVKSETYTEEEKREIERLTAEREARGEQVWY